ncbi:MAG: type II secretion system F family protein [Bdellovibrionales bacterium]|nr:type II secretion system F family protein [Bdellovibrionales bacterium]
MDMVKSFFLDPFILSIIVGFLVFVFFYIRWPGILSFFKDKTLSSQKEVLEIIDKMMIKTAKEKVVLWLWSLGLSFGFLIFLACWPHLVVGLGFGSIGFLFSWIGVQMVMRTLWEQRCNQVVDQMVEGLVIMTNGVKVGLSVTQSMERVIKNMKGGPLAQEFQLVLNKTRLGMSVEEAFNDMEQRMDRQDVTMMVVAINILKETGGNIAETLATISETIRERQKVQNKIKALTAQGTIQATIVSLVPFLLLVMMFLTNKQHAQLMLGTPLGWFSLLMILALIIIGGVLMKKIVTIKV